MVLVNTNVKDFKTYISSLTRKARKNYAYVLKHNKDLVYKKVEYPECREQLEQFMELWEQQLIRGKRVTWAFPIGHLDSLKNMTVLEVFAAYKGEEIIAMHFTENHNGYVEAHPPMYSKDLYSKRYMAKYMWFKLIEYAIESDIEWVDLGGGGEDNWRDMIKQRHKYPNPAYKWLYVPEEVKNNPDKQPRYKIFNNNQIKGITDGRI